MGLNDKESNGGGSVLVEIHTLDYIFSLIYAIVLLTSLVGVAKYA